MINGANPIFLVCGLSLALTACGGGGGSAMDSGPAPTDASADTGPADTGPADTGPADTGPADTGPADTGPADTGPADTGRIEIHLTLDPRATYLRTNSDTPQTPEAFDLASMGVTPGMTITLRRAGSFDNGNGSESHGLTGVFSSSDVILADTELHRVPGAIDAGDDFMSWDTYNPRPTGLTTDIPEDFEISTFSGTPDSVTLVVPAGAAFLFVSPLDSYFVDNLVTTGNIFELVIEG